MATKHFFKVLFVFTLMIALGLLSMVVISNYDRAREEAKAPTALSDSDTPPCEGEAC